MPAQVPISRGISHTFSRLPHAIQRPPTQAISPYGIAVPPYGHTPDASPHTFWQIPIGRPFSHSHGRSPIARPFPHTIHIIDKAAGFHFDENSVRSPQIPTNPDQQTPWTCVTVRQTNPQPVSANHLRYGPANQAPAKSSKSHMPAKGGSYLHVRPWLLLHWHARIHGHGYTFTGMRMHAYHGHTCTAMLISIRAHLRRDQRGRL